MRTTTANFVASSAAPRPPAPLSPVRSAEPGTELAESVPPDSVANSILQPEPPPDAPPPGFSFSRSLGETPRAFSAFVAWFQLGQARSHQAVADQLNEGLPTIKNWASKYAWSKRLLNYNSGLLQQQAADAAARQRQQAADWAQRLNGFREQEWDAAQKLLSAAQCFLETFGDEDLRKMTLSHVSRALRISSDIGRSALAGLELPPAADPAMSPIQQQMLDALKRLTTDVNKDSAGESAFNHNDPQPQPIA